MTKKMTTKRRRNNKQPVISTSQQTYFVNTMLRNIVNLGSSYHLTKYLPFKLYHRSSILRVVVVKRWAPFFCSQPCSQTEKSWPHASTGDRLHSCLLTRYVAPVFTLSFRNSSRTRIHKVGSFLSLFFFFFLKFILCLAFVVIERKQKKGYSLVLVP